MIAERAQLLDDTLEAEREDERAMQRRLRDGLLRIELPVRPPHPSVLHGHARESVEPVLLREILDMTEGSFYDVLLAQVFVNGFRLCRRFYDDEILGHGRVRTEPLLL